MEKCPKGIFISRHVIEIGVTSAVINFNDGAMGLSGIIFQSLDFIIWKILNGRGTRQRHL